VLGATVDGLRLLRRGRAAPAAPRRLGRLGVSVAVGMAVATVIGNEAVCRALAWLNPGLVSTTLRTQVIFVALGALVLLREPVGPRFWIGTAVALAAYALLRQSLDLPRATAWAGLGWAILAAASFAAMQVMVRRTVTRIDVVRVNALRLVIAVALLALWPGRAVALGSLDARTWALAAAAALCGPVLSRLCLMQALVTLPAAHATLAQLLAPVFAYLLAGLVLGVWPGPLEIVGGLVILFAVALPVTELRSEVPHRDISSP
jgi:drug/metabolite transporter (DMT)-like permease